MLLVGRLLVNHVGYFTLNALFELLGKNFAMEAFR